jgi:hypothetical protein
MTQQQRDIKRKLAVLQYAQECGNVALAARHFGIFTAVLLPLEAGLRGARRDRAHQQEALPDQHGPAHAAGDRGEGPPLRRSYHFGPRRIAWYLQRYHGITVSNNGVYGVLARAGLSRLPANCRKRSLVSKRYEKQVLRPPRPGRRQVPTVQEG